MKRPQFMIMVLWCCCILGIPGMSQASLQDPFTTIELDAPVHFLAADGSDVTVPPGTYEVESAEEWIRLLPGERRDAVLIEADRRTHPLNIAFPLAMAFSGDSAEEADLHFVMLLLPGGQSLEATGTYSGIRQRGGFNVGQALNNAKKIASNAYNQGTSTANNAASAAAKAAQQAAQQGQQAAQQGQQVAQQASQQAQQQAQQAASSAQKGVQSAQAAAMQAKQAVEKTVSQAGKAVTGGAGQWTLWSQTASAAARSEALGWLSHMFIDRNHCQVLATVAIGKPGVMKSRYSFNGAISKALTAVGASTAIAEGWDRAFKESWELWAKNVIIPGLPFYPAFAAFPGPQVPPMPNVPFPLSTLISAGATAMTPPALTQKVQSSIGAVANTQEAKTAINGFATDIGTRFSLCMGSCQMMNVMGSGPVPSFAPPFIPVGPVVNGSCTGGQIPVPAGFMQP